MLVNMKVVYRFGSLAPSSGHYRISFFSVGHLQQLCGCHGDGAANIANALGAERPEMYLEYTPQKS